MDESKTIQYAQSGDLAAFNRLVMAYQGVAYNVAYRILGDGEAAADVCQDAFISAFKGIGSFRGGAFKSWLLRIVTNTCYDLLRYRRRRPAVSLEGLAAHDEAHEAESAESAPWLEDDSAGPEELSMRGELAEDIQAAISTLPLEQRVVLVLSDIQGFSYAEISEIAGVSLGTVKSRLSRARGKVRDHLVAQSELLPSSYRLTSGHQQRSADDGAY
jgi:RNA polymerase sigma-70 factor, ECF subfamily